jgi:hypothetical protein
MDVVRRRNYMSSLPKDNQMSNWIYSHTQLAVWNACKQRYKRQYIDNIKEPRSDNMAAGTWLCQNPIEHFIKTGKDPIWEDVWQGFIKEFDGDIDTYSSKIFNLDTAKQILKLYKKSPIDGGVVGIEKRFTYQFPDGTAYSSRPDLLVEQPYITDIHCLDLKMKTFNQSKAGDTFFAKSYLSQFDDQGLGQAVLSGSQGFGQIIFYIGKKDGLVLGPDYKEHLLNPILAENWLQETALQIQDIERYRRLEQRLSWPKNSSSCALYGKPCPHLASCNFGG